MSTAPTIHEENESLIRQYQIDAGLSFPVNTAAAFSFCGALGYHVDRQFINYGFRSGFLDRPEKEGNTLLWSFDDVLALVFLLEKKRRWSPGHPRHTEKLTDDEFNAQKHDLTVLAGKMQVWSTMTVTQLMHVLVNEEDRHNRLAVASIFMSRLKGMNPDANA